LHPLNGIKKVHPDETLGPVQVLGSNALDFTPVGLFVPGSLASTYRKKSAHQIRGDLASEQF
jgi:hypothetical protein